MTAPVRPAELDTHLQACPEIEVLPARAVGPGLVSLIRGDLIVWSGPYELLHLAPKDCRRVILNHDDFAAWFPKAEEQAA